MTYSLSQRLQEIEDFCERPRFKKSLKRAVEIIKALEDAEQREKNLTQEEVCSILKEV